jgi:hypothetical protein
MYGYTIRAVAVGKNATRMGNRLHALMPPV